MKVQVESRDGIAVVRIDGELTGAVDGSLRDLLGDLAGAPAKRLVFDLGGVSFISSGGLGELVAIVAQSNVHESRVILAAPAPFVAGVLAATNLNRFFEMADTVEEAVTRLK